MWKRFWRWISRLCRPGSREELSADAFQDLTWEIREIAELSSKIWAGDNSFQDRIRRINKEMDQLDRLLTNKAFQRLSKEKKQELHQSLLVSRQELIRSLQSAPCPTDRMQ
jgi:predicted nuclease with TOPRIM domain